MIKLQNQAQRNAHDCNSFYRNCNVVSTEACRERERQLEREKTVCSALAWLIALIDGVVASLHFAVQMSRSDNGRPANMYAARIESVRMNCNVRWSRMMCTICHDLWRWHACFSTSSSSNNSSEREREREKGETSAWSLDSICDDTRNHFQPTAPSQPTLNTKERL